MIASNKMKWMNRLLTRVAFERAELPLTINEEKHLHFTYYWESHRGSTLPFNLLLSLEFIGELHIKRLNHALDELVRRHSILRSVFHVARNISIKDRNAAFLHFIRTGTFAQGTFRHSILRTCNARLSFFTLDPDIVDGEPILESIANREIVTSIPHNRAPLFRATLIKLAPTRHVLLITISHLISDALSLDIIKSDLRDIYAALSARKPTSLAEASFQFPDFAQWQRSYLCGKTSQPSIEYWKWQWSKYEAAALPCEPMLTSPDARLERAGVATRIESFIDEARSVQLKSVASVSRITPFMLCFAGLCSAIAQVNKRDQVGVWVSLSNRTLRNSQRGIGWFVNTHLLCIDLSLCRTIQDLFSQTRSTVLSALRHQRLPIYHIWNLSGRVPSCLGLPGSVRFQYNKEDSHRPLPCDDTTHPQLHMAEIQILRKPGIPKQTVYAKVREKPGGLALSLESDDNLIRRDVLNSLQEAWKITIDAFSQITGDGRTGDVWKQPHEGLWQ